MIGMPKKLGRLSARVRRDERGLSYVEFALILPVLLILGLYGTEVARMAMINMQIGQIASSVADNASRLGQTDNSAITPTVTESQIDSVMSGALVEGAGYGLNTYGRIILSSLERNTAGQQVIRWQRCRGSLSVPSRYGPQGKTVTGMGSSNPQVMATATTAVMYVEVSYTYQPLFGTMFVGNPRFRREAAFMVRDDRDLSAVSADTASKSTCT